MAVVFIITGSILGFASAIASMLLAEVGFLTALAIWVGIGTTFLCLGLALALMPRPAAGQSRHSQSA